MGKWQLISFVAEVQLPDYLHIDEISISFKPSSIKIWVTCAIVDSLVKPSGKYFDTEL